MFAKSAFVASFCLQFFTLLLHSVSTVPTKYAAKLLRPAVQISEWIHAEMYVFTGTG